MAHGSSLCDFLREFFCHLLYIILWKDSWTPVKFQCVKPSWGQKPQLNVSDLQALRQHCIRNPHATMRNRVTWARECFRKPFLQHILLLHAEMQPEAIHQFTAEFSGPKLMSSGSKDSENMFCSVQEERMLPSSSQKQKKTHQQRKSIW